MILDIISNGIGFFKKFIWQSNAFIFDFDADSDFTITIRLIFQNMGSRSLFLGCVLVALFGIILAQEVRQAWTRRDYPNPQTNSYDCGRFSKRSYLCDPNKLLSDDEANQLDLVLESVVNDTKCPCSTYACRTSRTGYVISVALMNKIEEEENYVDDGSSDIGDVIDHNLMKARLFAYTLESYTWNFGNCDEDIVILYSREDNALYTMTGEAARGKLRDAHIGEIAMMVMHKFGPNKNIFEGLHDMIMAYKKKLMR